MKTLYKIFFPAFSFFMFNANAQVGIGTTTPDPSAAVDMVAVDKGFLGPRIALTNRTDNETIINPADGLLVYNTTVLAGNENTELKPGYYFWYNGSWHASKKGDVLHITRDGILKSYLGYEPNGEHDATTFTVGGITYTGIGCKQWTGAESNDHWYCAYKADKLNPWWQEAFEAAKSKGGYLPTLTTLAEWNWLKTNLLDSVTGYDLTSSVWLGYNKVNFSGNPTEFTWITGETSKILWGNETTTEEYFREGEPNNQGENEGCVHIVNADTEKDEKKRGWNDITCANPGWANPYDNIIIEFEH